MKKGLLLTSLALALGSVLAACSSTTGPAQIPNAPGPTAAALNTTLGPLSYFSPEDASAVDETFSTSTATLTVNIGDGDVNSFNSSTLTDFRTQNSVSYDTESNSLTFDISQGDVDFQHVIAPILLRNPGDRNDLENDNLAILIAAQPELMAALAQDDASQLGSYFQNPYAADEFIENLKNDDSEEASERLARLNAAASDLLARDFFTYELPNGGVYHQLKFGPPGQKNTDYVTLGAWAIPPAAGASGDWVYGTSVFGKNTPISDVPNKGSGTYTGPLVGWLLRENKVEQMRGGVSITADFAKNKVNWTVDVDIVINGPNGVDTFSDIATLVGGGNLVGNRYFGGVASQDDPSLRGNLEGAFFGPQAVQTGGSLTFGNASMAGAGSFIGTRPTN